MDVQFHELEVLEGAIKTLKNNSPILCIECARRNNDELTYVKKIVNLLQKFDFKIVGGLGKELFLKNPKFVKFYQILNALKHFPSCSIFDF